MAHMPEIQRLLEDHLDIEKEASPSVRAVYGMRLGHIFFLDESWTTQRLDVIFDPAQPVLAATAWRGYVMNGYPAPRVLAHVVGAGLYDGPVDELSIAPDRDRERREAREARKQLVEHVGLAWCRGVAGSDALLDRLFSKATAEDRGHLGLVDWTERARPLGSDRARGRGGAEAAGDVGPALRRVASKR
jgi:hypothetical protein